MKTAELISDELHRTLETLARLRLMKEYEHCVYVSHTILHLSCALRELTETEISGDQPWKTD